MDIFLLYSCDAWKSHSSMSLIMATKSKRKIKREIMRRVGRKEMSYHDDNMKEGELTEVNKSLEYGHVVIVKDGAIQ